MSIRIPSILGSSSKQLNSAGHHGSHQISSSDGRVGSHPCPTSRGSNAAGTKSLETPIISASNEFMVMVGGQTQTTPTTILTPTYMKTFEEGILSNMARNGSGIGNTPGGGGSTLTTPLIPEIVLEAQLKHEHAAGFVPPLIQVTSAAPSSSSSHATNFLSSSLCLKTDLNPSNEASERKYSSMVCVDLSVPAARAGSSARSDRSLSFDQPATQDTHHLRPTDLSLSGSFHSSPSSRRSHNSGDLSNHGGQDEVSESEEGYGGESASELDDNSQPPYQSSGGSGSLKRSNGGYVGGGGATSDDGNSNSTHNSSTRSRPGDDDTRKKLRRERNKVAAARCRQRRVDQTIKLEEETSKLERAREALRNEINQLIVEKDKLAMLLDKHAPVCKSGGNREINLDKIDLKPNYAAVASHSH